MSHENDTESRIENSNKRIMKRVSDDEEIRDQSSNLNGTRKLQNDGGKHHQKRNIIKYFRLNNTRLVLEPRQE